MPRVGSSSSRTSASWCSRRARATFCWFPPERLSTGWSGPWVRMPSRPIQRRAASFMRLRLRRPNRVYGSRRDRVRLSATVRLPARPSVLRSSERYPTPWRIILGGPQPVQVTPRTRTSPLATGSRPKTARTSSVRPEPMRPAMPRISPRRSSRSASSGMSSPVRAARSSTGSPTSCRVRWYMSSSSRPTMRRMIWEVGVSATTPVPTACPSRSTVNRSAMARTSSKKWLM